MTVTIIPLPSSTQVQTRGVRQLHNWCFVSLRNIHFASNLQDDFMRRDKYCHVMSGLTTSLVYLFTCRLSSHIGFFRYFKCFSGDICHPCAVSTTLITGFWKIKEKQVRARFATKMRGSPYFRVILSERVVRRGITDGSVNSQCRRQASGSLNPERFRTS